MSAQLLSHDAAVDAILKAEKASDDDEKMDLKKKKAAKSEEDEGEEEEDEEEEEEDEQKSDLSEDDLMKSLDILTGTAEMFAEAPASRQSDLASRVAEGDQLSKAEADELADLLASGEGEADFEKSARESFLDDPTVADALEISDFLEAFVSKSGDLMDAQRETLQKSVQEQREVNLALARALQVQGSLLGQQHTLIKGMAERLGTIEAGPVAPKGVTRASQVGRPFGEAGGTAGIVKSGRSGEPLDRNAILDTMEDMISKSEDGIVDGNDLNMALTRYETTSILDRATVDQIRAHRAKSVN